MPGPIGPKTNFDVISKNMEKGADSLKESAATQLQQAGNQVNAAGTHAADAFLSLLGAGANASFATSKTLVGVSQSVEAAGHMAAAGGLATVGVAAWTTEGMRSGGRFVARNAATGFAAIANAFTRVLGDGRTTTVRELKGDPNAVRFSDRMFGASAKQLQLSADAMNLAWGSYVGAVTNLAGMAVNVGMAAVQTAAVAGNLATAAALTGSAGATKMAEYGVRLGSVAVQAAEQGVVGAREMAILTAKFSAATANVLANPDQGEVQVTVKNQLAAYNAELRSLVSQNPGLSKFTVGLAA